MLQADFCFVQMADPQLGVWFVTKSNLIITAIITLNTYFTVFHSFIHSLTHLLTHSLTHSHSFTHSLTHAQIRLPCCSFQQSIKQAFNFLSLIRAHAQVFCTRTCRGRKWVNCSRRVSVMQRFINRAQPRGQRLLGGFIFFYALVAIRIRYLWCVLRGV
jgi:hypothetical protein